ncbi:MAG: HEPN domain-containing protein [Thermodesulfovibrionales bacterium]|nr:HEPN domain-containing protein [Thermodesulfovibrionales bacterium]
MPYTDRFRATDSLIDHLKTFVGTITDPELKANYAGFLSVSSVTVYELAIKDIFCEFASRKNKVFGTVIERHFNRINGRIRIEDLKGTHIKLFGDKYLKKFNQKLHIKENSVFSTSRVSISADYGNLLTCRHEYVHSGSPTLTINEVIDNFINGKEIIHCLNEAMKR